MKKFISGVLCFVLIPIVILLVVYLVSDPFKTLSPFSLNYFDTTNRDYVSTELYEYNTQRGITYDSFIFGSSRCGGLNSYHWKHYLPEGSNQFVFQAWSETLTGILQKIEYLDLRGIEIKNALILLDIPGSFACAQNSTNAMAIKDYKVSGMPKGIYQSILFFDFLQKPSLWVKSINNSKVVKTPIFDVLSNDWDNANAGRDIQIMPPLDSMKNCSNISRQATIKKIEAENDGKQDVCEPLLTDTFLIQLERINKVFEKHKTSYKVIVAPAIWQINKRINPSDLQKLKAIFNGNVYDYSGQNLITKDYNYFSDPNHFGQSAGWIIIEELYGQNSQTME